MALRHFLEPLCHVKDAMYAELQREPLFMLDPLNRDSHDTQHDRHLLLQQLRRATALGLTFGNPTLTDANAKPAARAIFSAVRDTKPMWTLALGLHMMFCSVTESLGTEKHARFWKTSPETQSLVVFGCFALTELSHGEQ